ncbi:UNVERIFIED_CONTAM: hypothetical protein RMT77_018360 [Armadillidium vulgare]
MENTNMYLPELTSEETDEFFKELELENTPPSISLQDRYLSFPSTSYQCPPSIMSQSSPSLIPHYQCIDHSLLNRASTSHNFGYINQNSSVFISPEHSPNIWIEDFRPPNPSTFAYSSENFNQNFYVSNPEINSLIEVTFPQTTTEAQSSERQCVNCHTKNTSTRRKNAEKETLCNACGLHLQKKRTSRPSYMWTDTVKKRKRMCEDVSENTTKKRKSEREEKEEGKED